MSSSVAEPLVYPNLSSYHCDCCECECENGAPPPPSTSSNPVRYGDGQLFMSETDLSWSGFGMAWGHTRHYVNQLSYNGAGVNGNSWLVRELEYLAFVSAETICVVRSAGASIWFSKDGGDWFADFGVHATLVYEAGPAPEDPGEYVLFIEDTGRELRFYDELHAGLRGQLKAMKGAGGQEATLIYDEEEGRLTAWSLSEQGRSARFDYEYEEEGRIGTVVMTVDGTPLRSAEYDYYGLGDERGNEGDLMGVEVSQWNGEDWESLRRSHYRYYVSDEDEDGDEGFVHGLRYLVAPEAYERMMADGYPPEDATVEQLRAYADYRFNYDTSQRVTLEAVRAGAYTETFAYDQSAHSDGPNSWTWMTTVTRPDGSTLTVYSNYLYQPIFTVLADGGDVWYDGTRYNDESRVVKRVTSAAVASYDEGDAEIFAIKEDVGLVYLNSWYSSGDGAGHLEYEAVMEGEDEDSIVKLRAFEWVSHGTAPTEVVKKATEVVYQNASGGGSDPAPTSYEYTWHGTTSQVESVVTILPEVTTGENGSGLDDVFIEVRYDIYGRPTWSMDQMGFITLRQYGDSPDGRMSRLVRDVDTELYDDVPEGWFTPANGGLNLETDYEYDLFGRQTQELGPVHEIDDEGKVRLVRKASWTAYQDLRREVATAQGMTWGEFPYLSSRRIGPVAVTRRDRASRIVDVLRAVPVGEGRPGSGDEYPQETWTAWTSHSYDNQGFEVWRRNYLEVPASGAGLAGENFNQTNFGYDEMLRRNRTTSPGGTITWEVYDVRNNVTGEWMGTDATGGTDIDPGNGGADGNNMVQIRTNIYDGGVDKGNNLLTTETLHVNGSTTRSTSYGYDFRGRRTSSAGPISDNWEWEYDNRNNVTQSKRLSGTTVMELTNDYFDSRNQHWKHKITGYVGGSADGYPIESQSWRDETGKVIKSQQAGSRAWNKTVYDGIGRPVVDYLCYRTSGSDSPAATNSVTGNIVVSQTEQDWDAASNLIETRVLERFDDATGTGALVPPGQEGPQGRLSTSCVWADGVGREIASAAYGTNGGLPVVRPAGVPESSDSSPVNRRYYDDSGRLETRTDPVGLATLFGYDAMDRQIMSVENASATAAGEMRITEQKYAPDGGLEILTLKNAVTGDQVTRWIYGTTLDDSDIASSALLRAKLYPDNPLSLDPGSPGGSDRVSYTYNRQGQATSTNDQTGTTREFEYDNRGRLFTDSVTAVGEGVDDAVLCIRTEYDSLDRLTMVTSLDGSAPDDEIVNQVQLLYSSFGQLRGEFQSHVGPAVADSPIVAYHYEDGYSNLIRPQVIFYPDGRVVLFEYFGNTSAYLPRISGIFDVYEDRQLADYEYLGASRVVTATYPQPGVALTYKVQASGNVPSDSGSADPYVGLDRFGRDIDHRWVRTEAGSDPERIQYGYDPASRRTWRREAAAPGGGQDEAYRYDGLSQVVQRQRGNLNLAATAIGTEVAGEAFDYDPTGNWQLYTAWAGDDELLQPRTYNEANELRTFDGSGTVIAYDAAGRMTRAPAGELPEDGFYNLTWDAWGRLVRVQRQEGDTLLPGSSYAYDGLSRRTRIIATDDPSDVVDLYYDKNWKVIEERRPTGSGDTGDTYVSAQYVYGVRGRNDLILRDTWDSTGTSSSGGSSGGAGERLYALCDAMGSKTAIVTAEGGAVVERYGYSAFGMSRVMDENFAERGASLYDWQVRFHGEIRDSDTGWYNYGYRYYHPELGEWLSRDPLEEESDSNLYAFCGNDPVLNNDFYGLFAGSLAGAGACPCISISSPEKQHPDVLLTNDRIVVNAVASMTLTSELGAGLTLGRALMGGLRLGSIVLGGTGGLTILGGAIILGGIGLALYYTARKWAEKLERIAEKNRNSKDDECLLFAKLCAASKKRMTPAGPRPNCAVCYGECLANGGKWPRRVECHFDFEGPL